MIKICNNVMKNIYKNWIIISLFTIGFIFRFFLIKYQPVVSFDEVNYLKLATYSALHGLDNIFHTYWSPFYPLIIALFSKVMGNFEFTARFVSVLSGSIVIIPLYLLAKYQLSTKISLIAVALYTFYSPLAFLSTKIITEPLYTFLAISGILIAWLCLKKELKILGFVVGLIFGMTYLTRPEGIGLLLIFILINFILTIRDFIKRKKLKFMFIILLSVLGFIMISTPYLLFLHNKTGEWTISAKQKSLQQAEADVFKNKRKDRQFRKLSPDNKSLLIDQMFHTGSFIKAEQERGKPVIKVTPFLLIQKYFKNMYEMSNIIVPKVIPLSLVVFLILGLFMSKGSREQVIFDLYLLAFILFYWGVIIPLFHINHRYFLPLLPLCFIWIARGVPLFYSWLQNVFNTFIFVKKKKLIIHFLSLVIIILFVLLSYIPDFLKIFSDRTVKNDRLSNPIEYKRAGLWLKNNCKDIPVVMSHYQTVSYYAGNYDITESVSIPFNEVNRIIEYAKSRDVDYIVLSERYIKLFPLIENLFYMHNIPEELMVVHSFESNSGLDVVIYKVLYNK